MPVDEVLSKIVQVIIKISMGKASVPIGSVEYSSSLTGIMIGSIFSSLLVNIIIEISNISLLFMYIY